MCLYNSHPWWHHQMEAVFAVLALCAGNSPVTIRPVAWIFAIFFDLHLYKRFSKQSWRRWFETSSSHSLGRHRNANWPIKAEWCIHASLNTLRPRPNRRHFADDIFKRIFSNQNVRIPINISLKFVPKGPINNIPALVQIMAWRRPGDKPLSETMVVSLPTHICVARPQWVNWAITGSNNGLSSVRCQAIFWTNAVLLLIAPFKHI